MVDLCHSGLESALRAVLFVVLACWATWWVIGLAIALVDRRTAARVGPPLLRALLVAGTIAATATPSHASQGSPAGILDGLPMPQRPLTSVPAPGADETSSRDRAHVVAVGDCLWSIVRERAPTASDDQVAASVARWYAANRDLIGPDPDLIQPGQRLVPPGAS